MITRGTTPYHTFILPLKAEDIEEIYITYLQNDEVILDKSASEITEIINISDLYENASIEEVPEELRDCMDEDACRVTLHLTQEDTLKFKFHPAAEKNIAVIQIRVLMKDGEAYASDPLRERIFGVLKDGVIGGE